ncbi:MAG: isoleucine--tRNA ligase [Candidatus Marinimicrobia bacterium]|nr:isoleucine--tRNA ligase [Candidatus Neomarinimicrobiota bacterium]
MKKKSFKDISSKVDFIKIEHSILKFWEEEDIFQKLVKKNQGNEPWSFLDGPITANNPMGVHHAWGRTLKDMFQRYHAMQGYDLRYQNGFDCQGLWVEVEVEKELGFSSKRDVEDFGIEKFVNMCKERVRKYSAIQTEQSKRLGYWMDWENSYFTMSDENNYTIWSFLKKLFDKGKIYKGTDVVPWSGRSGTSYSQMEIIEGRKLVAHDSVFVRFPIKGRDNEYLLVWTTTPWTLTSNVAVACNIKLDYVKLEANDGSFYYFAKENLEFKRLEKQFQDKKLWIDGVPKLKTIAQIFKERGGYNIVDTIKGQDMLDWEYEGPFDHLDAQKHIGGYPFENDKLKDKGLNAVTCHRVIDGGKDSIGNDVVVAGEGTGLVHVAPGCGAIDNKLGKKIGIVEIAPLNDEGCYLEGFDYLTGLVATSSDTKDKILEDLKDRKFLIHVEKYPHIYPHCWRSGDELVYRSVEEWYIDMDWRDQIKDLVGQINWIPDWGHDREMEWLENMGDWMISKKRFWGLALPIWKFEDDTFHVVGSKEELKELAVEGWDEFEGKSPHRPWIDKVKIKHPKSGLIGTRIPDVGNPWLDAGIVPYSTLSYNENREYWDKWFPADFVVECFPGQFRNWFYSLLAMSTVMENKPPFKTLLGHALVKDETGRDMHKSWGNAIWFDDAAEKMGVDVMRWLYANQNPEHNLHFGYGIADDIRKNLITLWNTYSFFITYANLDGFNPSEDIVSEDDYTDLDKWILSKTQDLIKEANSCYQTFKVFNLMKLVNKFIDDLSNWYVRRSRRRFWRSENNTDKLAAYSALYQTLVDLIKILAPIAPYITENIYNNLVLSHNKKAPESIHLCEFPKFNSEFYDASLVNKIDSIISIVSLGRSARNRANIKNRQPLQNVYIYLTENKSLFKDELAQREILEELNIKECKFVETPEDIVKYEIKPNFQLLKERFDSDMKDVISELSKISDDIKFKMLNDNGVILLNIDNNQIEVSKNELIINEIPKEGLSASSYGGVVVAIDKHISDKLLKEGIVRDVIRHVQNFRKESDLEVQDRIKVGIKGNQSILDAINENKNYFMNEILAVSMSSDVLNSNYIKKIELDGLLIEIGISVSN